MSLLDKDITINGDAGVRVYKHDDKSTRVIIKTKKPMLIKILSVFEVESVNMMLPTKGHLEFGIMIRTVNKNIGDKPFNIRFNKDNLKLAIETFNLINKTMNDIIPSWEYEDFESIYGDALKYALKGDDNE
ncbi:hypothetical protein KAR91_66430 [Candidatus Pacearchaeota archaeon]|nr:hypothetical protein [Candidatus Pacearchaeota archaeon]